MAYKRNDTPEMKAACLECERNDCDGECDAIREMRRERENDGRLSKQMYTIDGRTQSITDWCREYGVPSGTVYYRITKLGMSLEEALKHERMRRSGRKGVKVTIDGETFTVAEWAKRLYIHKTSIYKYAERNNCDVDAAIRYYVQQSRSFR